MWWKPLFAITSQWSRGSLSVAISTSSILATLCGCSWSKSGFKAPYNRLSMQFLLGLNGDATERFVSETIYLHKPQRAIYRLVRFSFFESLGCVHMLSFTFRSLPLTSTGSKGIKKLPPFTNLFDFICDSAATLLFMHLCRWLWAQALFCWLLQLAVRSCGVILSLWAEVKTRGNTGWLLKAPAVVTTIAKSFKFTVADFVFSL